MNKITISGFVNNLKKLEGGMSVFDIQYGIKNKEDDNYTNYWIKCKTKLEVTEKERYSFSGFLTGEFWTPKAEGSKERNAVVLFLNEFSEDTKNSLEITGYPVQIKEFAKGKGSTFNLSFGCKTGKTVEDKPEYKNAFIKVVSSVVPKDGEKIDIVGFLSGETWVKEEKTKRRNVIIALNK